MTNAEPDRRTYSIQARGLNLWYGDLQALKNVDVDVRQGSITALIGPSGCGKTTLLRCINRLNERFVNVTTTGRITVFGKNIYDADVSLGELRKTVGMVFQRPNPLPISIYENIAFGLRVHSATGALSRRNSMSASSRHSARCCSGTRSRMRCESRPCHSHWSSSRSSVSHACSRSPRKSF